MEDSTASTLTGANASSNIKVQEVKNVNMEKRIASHSHITGLGLNEEGYALPTSNGFVGQAAAREVSVRHKIIVISNTLNRLLD